MSILKQIGNIQYRKPKPWLGNGLFGLWHISTKVDGIRTFINTHTGEVTSRNGKPLYNFSKELIKELHEETGLKIIDCETYRTNWETSSSLCRTKKDSDWNVKRSDIYILTDDDMDRRLNRGYFNSPSKELINNELDNARAEGKEGLVLRKGYTWWKAKPTETYDVSITGYFEGKGKHSGSLGGFTTDKGNVGTGFFEKSWESLNPTMLHRAKLLGHNEDSYNRKCRSWLWKQLESGKLEIGTMIEVKVMELTTGGNFRFPTFERLREDK